MWGWDDEEQWLRRFRPARPGAPRLICFPRAGASAETFRPLCGVLAPRLDMLAVQYPGRGDRWQEGTVDDIVMLADRLARVFHGDPDMPFVFLGHEMGALVAFEVTRALADVGVAIPAHLVVVASHAPYGPRLNRRVHQFDDDGIINHLRGHGLIDPSPEAERVARSALPAIRADYRAAETYRYQPGPKLTCPVTAVVGNRRPSLSIAEARIWSTVTLAPFDLEVVPGRLRHLDPESDAVKAISAVCERVV